MAPIALRLIVVAAIAAVVQSKGLRDSQQVELQAKASSSASVGVPKVKVADDGSYKNAVLYTQDGEPPPEPQGLYRVVSLKEGADPFSGMNALFRHKYVPNVWLFERKDYSDEDPNDPKDYAYSPTKGNSHVKFDLTHGMGGLQHALSASATDTETMTQTPPTMSVVALNDCARFAQFMMWLLKDSGQEGSIEETVAKASAKTPLTTDALKTLTFGPSSAAMPAIGDSFQLKYGGGGHHGLTVVSVGTGYFVCLEAHASKHLKKPYFHVYTDMSDFVAKNFPNPVDGDKAILITPDLGPGSLDSACKASAAKLHAPLLKELMAASTTTDKKLFEELTFTATYLPSLEEA